MSPITICHPIHAWATGGTERQLAALLRHLPTDRFRHIVLTRSGGAAPALPSNVLSIDLQRPESDPRFAHTLADQLREHRVDILHLRGLSMLLDGLLAAERAGDTAVVLGFHGFESAEDDLPALRKPALGRAALRCDARWAVSAAAARSIERSLRLPMGCFIAKPNGVNVERFAPAANRARLRAKLGLPTERKVILSVGNFKPVKGQAVLIDAMSVLSAALRNNVTIAFIGRDDLNGQLHHIAAELLPDCDARFITDCADPLPWYQSADAFVLPSRWEGMSNALLEAMATELPVIATRVGGNVDAVEHDRTGLLVPPDDARALAEAIAALFSSPARAAELAAAARAHVVQHFNIQTTLNRYAAGYESLARRRQARNVEMHP